MIFLNLHKISINDPNLRTCSQIALIPNDHLLLKINLTPINLINNNLYTQYIWVTHIIINKLHEKGQ